MVREFSRRSSALPKFSKGRASLMIAIFLGIFACLAIHGLALAQQSSPPGLPQASSMQRLLGVDPITLIQQSDAVGKGSLLILALFSIASWTVIIYKYRHIRQAHYQTNAFVDLCSQVPGGLREIYKRSEAFPDSPLAQIFHDGYAELEMENWYRDGTYALSSDARIELARISMERSFERTIANEITHLESQLAFLATTTHVCPFIGLFGTVWGIMGAFQVVSMTTMGTGVSLSSLAPGIATALMTTVGGLFCAIPASVMYNYLTHQIRLLISRMDSFSLELGNIFLKDIMKQSVVSDSGYAPATHRVAHIKR